MFRDESSILKGKIGGEAFKTQENRYYILFAGFVIKTGIFMFRKCFFIQKLLQYVLHWNTETSHLHFVCTMVIENNRNHIKKIIQVRIIITK